MTGLNGRRMYNISNTAENFKLNCLIISLFPKKSNVFSYISNIAAQRYRKKDFFTGIAHT